MKIFCLPYAGGSSAIYCPWKKFLDCHYIIPIDLPGHGLNINMELSQSFSENLDFIYDKITNEISDSEEYCIFGHSLGGLFTFEVCRKIEESHFKNPFKIFISATESPIHKKRYDLDSDDKLKNILKEYNSTPSEILENEELFDFFKPIILNDFLIYNNYRLSDYTKIKTPITIFYGTNDSILLDDLLTWQPFCTTDISYFPIIGDHFFINTNSYDVLTTIKKILQ